MTCERSLLPGDIEGHEINSEEEAKNAINDSKPVNET